MRFALRRLAPCIAIAACTPAPQRPHRDEGGSPPPKAATVAHTVASPNGNRNDPYYWLRDDKRRDPEVLGYLKAETAYTAQMLAPVKSIEDTVFGELRGRIKEDDSSVPVLEDGYWYYSRFATNQQQPIYARRRRSLDAPEEIILDGNQLAAGHDFYRIGAYQVSRNGQLVAWTDDVVGRNQYTLHLKNLATGQLLADTATNIAPIVAWANDDKTLFYVAKDPTTLREDRVVRHVLGSADQLVFKEDDGSYDVALTRTKSRRYIEITVSATTNTEVRLLDADKPEVPPRVFLPRTKDELYDVDHLDRWFVMRTNAHAKNFRVVVVADGSERDRSAWKDLIPHRDDVLIEDFAIYHGFIAATIRTGGLRELEILPNKRPAFFVDAPDPAYAMTLIDTPDADAKRARYTYDSLVAPRSVYEVDVSTGERTLLKQQPVPGYDPARYASEYVHARATDGTLIPLSIVYKKGTKRDGSAPLLIYGYGSYGISMEPAFQSSTVSLLDRGWVYAIAHVRGGQEKGRAWYEDGRQQHKLHTFTDFIAATEYLVAQKYGARDHVFAQGASAGGLLMGAILNMRPDLYRGVLAIVPFVDVVTTMLDETIPLTTNEFDEWGNPKLRAAYDYMLAYSPYDNVKAQAYPAIFVHTGLWDSQVQYYEPAKWVAKLRATKTDDNLVVLDVDMTSGHRGAAGRFDYLRQVARQLAFLLYVDGSPDRRGKK